MRVRAACVCVCIRATTTDFGFMTESILYNFLIGVGTQEQENAVRVPLIGELFSFRPVKPSKIKIS